MIEFLKSLLSKPEKVWVSERVLEPLEDITAYELALLMKAKGSSVTDLDDLPPNVQRHMLKIEYCAATGEIRDL